MNAETVAIRVSAKLKAAMQGGILMGDFALHTGDLVFGYDMGGTKRTQTRDIERARTFARLLDKEKI